MGGYGSGTRGTYRRMRLVESCCFLEVLAGGKVNGTTRGGNWRMTVEANEDGAFLELRGELNGWKTEQSIELLFWTPRFGGKSMWLLCPRCGQKSRKLYMPPNTAEYRCRRCWKLTYWTSQNAHFFDRGLFGVWTLAFARKAGITMKQAVHDAMQERKAEALGV